MFLNKEKFQKELDEKQKELDELTKKLSDKELEIEGKKQIAQQNTDMRYECLETISNQDVLIENLDKRQKSVKQELTTVISELDEARDNKQEMGKGFLEIESKKEKMEQSKSGSGSNSLRAGNYHSSLCGCENVPHVCGKTGRLQCEDGDNIRK